MLPSHLASETAEYKNFAAHRGARLLVPYGAINYSFEFPVKSFFIFLFFFVLSLHIENELQGRIIVDLDVERVEEIKVLDGASWVVEVCLTVVFNQSSYF